MRIYPAIRARMGNWNYYIVRMKMREVASEIHIAQDFYKDNTLSDAVQRTLGDARVKKEIVGYLAQRSDRFFSSIVVASMAGEPAWHPVEMDTETVPSIFAKSKTLRESFGVLSFGDEPKYYALDGQHRVAAIKLLVNGETDYEAPQGFDDDLLSVIVVLREEHDVSDGEWLRRYRRLFSSLNRWAKKTDNDTNIIMDEDDLFAILTRRLITDHEFFQAPGRQKESFKVKTRGKPINVSDGHFTTLQTLYAMNEILLRTRSRENHGWDSSGAKLNKQVRPDEQFVDDTYDELASYWDAILDALPILGYTPASQRQHDPSLHSDDIGDNLCFWPIGQELLAGIVRNLLDATFAENGRGAHADMVGALGALRYVPFSLHSPPFRHLLLVHVPERNTWRIRSEERKLAVEVARRIVRWLVGLDELDREGIEDLRMEWRGLLYLDATTDSPDDMWDKIEKLRHRVLTDASDPS